MLAAPLRERNLFVTGPGPASGGSKPGKDTRAQWPEKSGIDAAPCAPPLAGPAARPAVCPQAGTAAATRVDLAFMMAVLCGEWHPKANVGDMLQCAPAVGITAAGNFTGLRHV